MSERREYWIKLPNGDKWSPERRRDNPKQWQEALAHCKGLRGSAACLCLQNGDRPLYITTRAKGMLLARHPDTGAAHNTNCTYYSSSVKQSGRGTYGKEDIVETVDGRKKVRLNMPLSKKAAVVPREDGKEAPSGKPQSSSAPGRMTMLGLLHLLWEESNLHRWHPNMTGRRTWPAVRNALIRAAEDIEGSGGAFRDRLVVLPPHPAINLRQEVAKDLKDTVVWSRRRNGQVDYLLLIAELRSLRKGPKSTALHLAHGGGGDFPLSLFCTHELAKSWETSFPDCFRAIGEPKSQDRVIALFLVECRERDGKILGDVLAGGMMVTLAEFIPFASSYERTVGRMLIDQDRWFEKPLRYDAANEWCLPDFVLLDTAWRHLPMEVYGRNDDPAYTQRREEKRALYEQLYGSGRSWEWIVNPSYPDAVPGFTQKRNV